MAKKELVWSLIMKNAIVNWSYTKPVEEGIYLLCLGDCETIDNIQPFRLVKQNAEFHGNHPWITYDVDFIAGFHDSFKFAKLSVGAEALEVINNEG